MPAARLASCAASILAQRDEHGAEIASGDQRARGGDDLILRADRHARRLGELAAVRLQHAGAAIGCVVGALGVDDHRLAGGAGGGNDGGGDAVGKHALGIVRDDDDGVVGNRLLDEAYEIPAHIRAERGHALAVGAQHLLGGGDVAGFHRGHPPGLDQDVRLDIAGLGNQLVELAPRRIVADHRDEAGMRAQRLQVAQHIAGAARRAGFAPDAQDRDRRLGRHALDLTVDVVIEHHVADAQDARLLQAIDAGDEGGAFSHRHERVASVLRVYGCSAPTARKTARIPLGPGRGLSAALSLQPRRAASGCCRRSVCRDRAGGRYGGPGTG